MRPWHTFILSITVVACGGAVSDPTPTSTSSVTGDPPPVSAGSSGSGSSDAPVASPPAPQTPPAPSVFTAATAIEVKGAVLGAAPGKSNARSYTFTPSPTTVTRTVEGTSTTLTLEATEIAELAARLEQVREVAIPTLCAYDGPAAAMTVTRSGTATTYLPEDYNCLKRTDVSYAAGVGGVLAYLDLVAASR